MQSKKSSLSTLSNEALCKLRDEIAGLLNSRAKELRQELKRLTGDTRSCVGPTNGKNSIREAKRQKLAPKYRGPDGKTWCGRGARPQWLSVELKNGKKLEDFLILHHDKNSAEFAKH